MNLQTSSDNARPKRVAVIGAGPAGIAAAYSLAKAGVAVDVFEAGPSVGGLARTLELWNQKVDLGPHRFFSSDNRVNRLWLEVVGADYQMVDRLTRIYYENKFFHYPVRPFDALFKLGLAESTACLLSYVQCRISPPRRTESFEDWVVSRFGRRLFEIFFKTYSERLWGIPCHELDADFAVQRIKKLSLSEAIKHALFGARRNKHRTLLEQFAYPLGGTGMVYERMASYVNCHGGRVCLRSPVERVITQNGELAGIQFPNGERAQYDYVVSTMPITLLLASLPEVPGRVRPAAQTLGFRNTILVYLNVHSDHLFQDQWLYVHARELTMGRITNFRNWVPQLYGKERSTILALEYWCDDTDPIWVEDSDRLIALASSEVRSTRLTQNAHISGGYVHRIHRCYPVYRRGYKDNLRLVEQYLSSIKRLFVIGRYGSFKYNNQDHSLLMGILAAENIVTGARHDLWGVNTDYEYQESSLITKAGLVKDL